MSQLLDISSILFFILLILCLYCIKNLRLFVILITVIYYLIGCGAIGKLLTINNTYSTNTDSCENTSAIVLLGAGVNTSKTLEPGLAAYDRILKTAEVYYKSPQKIIISGGYTNTKSKDESEAQIYSKELLALGIKKEDLILEEKSKNTYQNAKFVKNIILNNTKQVCLITDALHLRRSKIYFDSFGISSTALASSKPSTDLKLLPSSYNIYTTQRIIHEYLGLIKAYIQSK